jgi:hypothetical protein
LEQNEQKCVTLGADYGVAQNVPQPSVGRIVHFYTGDVAKHFNGLGSGPYPAIVTQVRKRYANLKVFPPFAEPYDAGSVSHVAVALEHGYSTYWEWPPKV